MIEASIQTKVAPHVVWQFWSRAHEMEKGFVPGQKGKFKTSRNSGFAYRILDVQDGKSFTILWKSLFVRLIFTHSVLPVSRGSEITYRVQIRGLFAWPTRYFLSEKIRRNLQTVLKSIVSQLES